MTYRFSPPNVSSGELFRADADVVTQRLWGHFRPHRRGTSVLRHGDTFTDASFVYSDDIDAADAFYQGGHVYEVSDAEAAALIEAGYAEAVEGPL